MASLLMSPVAYFEALISKDYVFKRGYETKIDISALGKVVQIAKKYFPIDDSTYLPWETKFLGSTGYIDGINDLGNKKFVWGYDPNDRPFIAFQYQVARTGGAAQVESTTLFSRYPNNSCTVQAGSRKVRLGNFDDAEWQTLKTLFSGGRIPCEYGDNHYITLTNERC